VRLVVAMLLSVLVSSLLIQHAAAGSLASVSPGSASAGITLTIAGTGFDASAGKNDVTFTPQSGSPVTAPALTVIPIDATQKRLTVKVPSGLPAGTTAIRVTNKTTGEQSAGRSIEVISFTKDVDAATPGSTQTLTLTGSPNTRLTAASTRVTFSGSGITVNTTTVPSVTTVTVNIAVAGDAPLGPRDITIVSGSLSALQTASFTIVAPHPNHPPSASAGGPYSGSTGQAFAFNGSASDADGDPLTLTWDFGDGTAPGSGSTPTHTYGAPGHFTAIFTADDGKGGQTRATADVTVSAPNRPPTITSTPPTQATEAAAYAYQVVAGDPDGDPIAFRLLTSPAGMTLSPTGAIAWTPSSSQVGSQDVTLEASDNRGGSDHQSFTIAVASAVTLTGIDVSPAFARFSALETERPFTVTGLMSDGSSIDLTSAADTAYASDHPFVATVDAAGVAHAVGNGNATISVRHGQFTDSAAIVVEAGVTLESLELSPAETTLRNAGATVTLALRGRFSDGDTRDLTTADGTTYRSSSSDVATVDRTGGVVAVKNGDTTITAGNDVLTATATIHVTISTGTGFVRGAVRDDSKGLPLAGATATLVADGGGAVASPVTTMADDRGLFALAGRAGDAVVRITRPGFTTVERRAVIPAAGVATLLDARLTPIDPRANTTTSAFGALIGDSTGGVTATIPPGGLGSNADLRLTLISGQGLAGRLPSGWSPVAAIDVVPAGVTFGQPVTMTVPNVAGLDAGADVVVAAYDTNRHAWVVVGSSRISADARSIALAPSATGQIVCLVADDQPSPPASAAAGDLLPGTDAQSVPADVTASGEVVPRSAPPGDETRAVGRILLQHSTPLSSGAVIQGRVSERFDLIDQSQTRPEPFNEDIVLYARGRPPGAGSVGASFPITPSRSYTIQELLHGVVSIEVTTPEASAGGIVGGAGGTVTDGDGDTILVPPGALAADAVLGVSRASGDGIKVPAPAGFDLVAALDIDLVGQTLAQPVQLSTPAPSSIAGGDQLLLALVFTDATGTRRLRLAGVAALESGRIVSHTTVGALTFPGVVTRGQYMFLRAAQPVGFVTGRLLGAGATPRADALATTDSAPFADTSSPGGRFIVAAAAGLDVTVRGLDLATHDTGSVVGHVVNRDDVVSVDVVLGPVAPAITTTSPAAGATNVPLDSPITIDFSQQIDPAGVTESGVVLADAAGAVVSGQRTLSAGRLRLVFTPTAPLQGKTSYNLSLTSLKSLSGTALAGLRVLGFTTLDPSKPTLGASGLITAALPDEGGIVLITGGAGASAAGGAVAATNLRTQETATVMALDDGSFKLRLTALVGDQIALTLHDASGRDTTVSLTQFQSADGTTSVGAAGGVIHGAGGRTGSILPRALTQPGVVRIADTSGTLTLPVLPEGFSYADRFRATIDAAQFTRLSSLTVSESQNRIAPQSSTGQPFGASVDLTVPGNFLVNASLQFAAAATDASGVRRTAPASTLVVASVPDVAVHEVSLADDFPSVFVDAPAQALPNQLVHVEAIAPTARIDLLLPSPAAADAASTLLLARVEGAGADAGLAVVDSLEPIVQGGAKFLRTSGRALPGLSTTGDYVVVASRDPLVFVTGRLSGAAATARVDGLPFVFESDGPNGTFTVPTRAGQPFTIRYVNSATAEPLGSSTGQAPSSGRLDVGQPLSAPASQLTVAADLDANTVVDINALLTFTFSDPVDVRTLASGIVVSDAAGARVFGSLTPSDDGKTATFKPSRRWRYGTTYRWGATTSIAALSGARLTQQTTGEFTTFAPRVASTTVAGGAVHDVAASGTLAVAASDAGLTLFDVSSAAAPVAAAPIALTGGARGVALIQSAGFADRTGQTHSGTFAAVADGDANGVGKLDIFDVTTPTAPSLIGSTQLTTAPGQTPVQNVPSSAGTPNAVIAIADGRAFAAVQGIGLESLQVSNAVPPDAASPGRALASRYPAGGLENINQAALLGDRILAAGAAGLTSLDAATLQRRGGISTTGDARAVAGLTAFSIDLNGDGSIADTETFDLGVVANGSDGTLQFFRVPPAGDPVLLSVVRFAGETTSVVLDAAERLAYVGLGVRGVAVVDLDGPASVQPLDADHNGVDDRVLAVIDTPGEAGRVALALGRGAGFVADGSAGLTALQLLPPRTRFTKLDRDPVTGHAGDEQSILDTRTAFATDDALLVSVNASVPDDASLALVIEEQLGPNGVPALSFENGGRTATLAGGSNDLLIRIAPGSSPEQVILRTHDESGKALADLRLRIVAPDFTPTDLQQLFIAPAEGTIGEPPVPLQLKVGGQMADGRVFNLTAAGSGTVYQSDDERIAAVDANGLTTGLGGGTANIAAQHGSLVAFALVQVDRAVALAAFEASRTLVSLRTVESIRLPVVGVMTDHSTRELDELSGTAFSSQDPAIVTISAAGDLTPIANGATVVTARNGSVSVDVPVSVDLRTPTAISTIALVPFDGAVAADAGAIAAVARVTGSGSLDGLTVTFDVTGPAAQTVQGVTNIDGAAGAQIAGMPVGTYTVTASVVDPSNGQIRNDSEALIVTPAPGDNEPNDDPTAAVLLPSGRTAAGSVEAGVDARDSYRVANTTDGTVTISLNLGDGTAPADVSLVIRAADGTVLQRITPAASVSETSLTLSPGAFVSVEALNGRSTYQLSVDFAQADVTIRTLSPSAGPAGTPVTIDGGGFSTVPSANSVLFGGVVGKIVAATSSQLVVMVPANAVNGPVEVIVGSRHAIGPTFNTGNAGPLAQASVSPRRSDTAREDPVSGLVLDITRLRVNFDPLVTQAQVEALAVRLGGSVAGVIPSINTYVLEFAANSTLDGLAALRRQLRAEPGVVTVARNLLLEPHRVIDQRDNAFLWPGTRARSDAVWQQIKLFEAIEVVRSTPPFHERSGMKDVKVAVIDDGFAPNVPAEFHRPDGSSFVTLKQNVRGFGWLTVPPVNSLGRHGTGVTSIIAATNDGSSINGALNGFLNPDEAPFAVSVYLNQSGGSIDESLAIAALDDIRAAGDVDVVNMSFGLNCGGDVDCLANDLNDYRGVIRNMTHRTLVVMSAGNDAVTADSNSPSILASEPALPNTISAGATAVVNVDRTGERADRRAVFATARKDKPGNTRCKPSLRLKGSNCSPGVTMAAPGEDYVVVDAFGSSHYRYFNGTSSAAPAIAAIAAMMQAIRGTDAIIEPGRLRQLLVDSGDDISDLDGSWDPRAGQPGALPEPPMKRLNALAAVRAILPASSGERIYVTDEGKNSAGAGHVIGIDVNPLTGDIAADTADAIADLVAHDSAGNAITFDRPSTIAIAPTGDRAYVIARGPASIGDALFALDTRDLHVEDAFGLGTTIAINRPGLALSRDGRLAYIATGSDLLVVNVGSGRVNSFSDLPDPYKTLSIDFAESEFQTRMTALHTLAATEAGGANVSWTGVRLSPDGRTLFATIERGGGTGSQPGVILPIDVDLYQDTEPDTTYLVPDLTRYLLPALPPVRSLKISGAGTPEGGDEPSDVAVSPDGHFLYLTNGGEAAFVAVSAASASSPAQFDNLASTASAGLIDQPSVTQQQLRVDFQTFAQGGLTLLDAPGYTAAFPLNPADGSEAVKFPSEVVYSWNPPASDKGRVVNQLNFKEVYAKRPFGITLRPDGNRALVSFFQTGNFGVLDLEQQQQFPNPFLQSAAGAFTGLVGVTPSIRLDNYLWPSRGAFTSSDGTVVPSPDESLLFPGPIEYAQNGRFAVATHAGVQSPGAVDALLPDFANDLAERLSLSEIGFNVPAGSDNGTDPSGQPVSSFEHYLFDRGGGAVTILLDDAITNDLQANAGTFLSGSESLRPYYSTVPVCKTANLSPSPRCTADAFTRLFTYRPSPTTTVRFDHPRGVAVQPFVYVETPRFADPVGLGTLVRFAWRDSRVARYRARLFDLGAPNSQSDPIQVTTVNKVLSSAEAASHAVAHSFRFFLNGETPQHGHRYRVEIVVMTLFGDAVSIVQHELLLK
jgi:hypothetical protein